MRQVPPTGRVARDADGLEVIVSRSIPAPASEVWEWVTRPEQVRRWYGAFRGTPRPGSVHSVKLTAEEGSPTVRIAVVECVPGERYVIETAGVAAPWRITVSVADLGASSRLFIAQRIETAREAGEAGPGWEYYLDRLIAAREGGRMPDFADYFPSQRPYYERLAMDGDPVAWPAT